MRYFTPSLLIASLMLAGCGSSLMQSPEPTPVPPLRSDLAAPCDVLTAPTDLDYDAWLSWTTMTVLPAYAVCAQRHLDTVKAWPATKLTDQVAK